MSQRPRPPEGRPPTIQAALDQAAAALQARNLADAERLAAGVLRSNRNHAAAAQLLGQALLLQGRAQDAIAALAGPARKSLDPALETLLARALTDAGRGGEALDRLRAATTRRPVYPLAFLELGDRLGQLGRDDEAVAVFAAGLEAAPDALVLKVGLAFLRLGRHELDAARALFAEVRTAAPHRRDALLGLAHVLVADADYEAAAALYRQALETRPDDLATRLSLAKCLLEMGAREAGETALRDAARGGNAIAGPAITALAAASHGRLFLRPSAAVDFLRGAA